ncbi:MAG: LPS-assembly protein LptD [Treponema sp.]|nr:LPS-assembly protein LptD [Treponema sp.]
MKFNGKSLKLIFFSILMLFSFKAFAEDDRTVITIENAKTSQYSKAKDKDTDVIILSGDVKISVSKGSTKNVISADVIRYDRASEMMYAEGNVTLEQTGSTSGSQTVTASSLMFNTATLEGVFDDGRVVQTKSDALNLPSGSTLVVASDIFGRSESNTIAFKDGVLTFCGDGDPHWKIRASRIWLLPGGEFAFFNAFLFVGIVPVFYLPAFYYPKDELIFNPVFGYEKRKGYYIQTTAYLYGRKPLSTSTSSSSSDADGTEKLKALFNFIKPSTLKEQVREGLVYHNLDEDFKGDTSNYLKVMGDYYTNLGVLVGVDGVFKPKKVFNNLEFNFKAGISNTVFYDSNGNYLPYTSTGEKVLDSSNLLGFKLPFRYSGNLKFSINKPFTFSLSLPVYSDPFFTNDFAKDREESMDWISFLTSQASDDDTTSTSEVSSFTWQSSLSYTVPLPSVIKPYLNTASLSMNSSLGFSTKSVSSENLVKDSLSSTDLSKWRTYTPERKFYYPSQITPVTLSATISGTLLDYSSTKKKAATKNPVPSFVSSLEMPGELLTAKQKEERAKNQQAAGTEASESQTSEELTPGTQMADSQQEKEILPKEAFPSMATVTSSLQSIEGLTASIKYSIKPNFTTQLAYSSDKLEKPEDFEWKNLKSSMYTFKLPVTLDNSLSYGGSFFSISSNFAYNPIFQAHPFISTDTNIGGYTETSAKTLVKTDYAAQKQDLTNTNSVSFKPFTNISFIKNTGITYRNTIKFVRTEFLGDEFDSTGTPSWIYHGPDFTDSNSVTTHALDFIFSSNQYENKFSQTLTLTTTLKPQAEQYYANLKLVFPYVTAGVETGFKKSSTADDAVWVKQPIKQSCSISLFNNSLKLTESYNYNMEDSHHDSFKASLSWKNLSLSYTMSYTYGYDMSYNSTTGEPEEWVQRSEKEFLPYNFSFTYNSGTKTLYTWKNRISMGLGFNSNITADMLLPTSSYFTFSPSISFKIQDFLTFSFSSTSKNSVIYRYFGNKVGIPGETNVFVDLFNSFRFDNEELRKASGFKLKSLNFNLTHELHDWDFTTTFKIEPRLVTENSSKYYDFSPYLTIAITWRPMSSMKAEIIDKYGEWSLN